MKVMLWGAGGNSKIFLKMLEENYNGNFEVTGIFENNLDSIPFKTELPIFKTKTELYRLIKISTHFIISIGNNGLARYEISKKLKSLELKPLNLISNSSILDDLEKYGEGIYAMPGAIVHKFTEIGDQCIFNTNSTVDHDCILGNGVHVMGGASISGRVNIGDFSKEQCSSIAAACKSEEGPGKPIFPCIGGGMSLKTADAMKKMYGNEAVYLLGGSLLRYGDKIGEGIVEIKKALT